MKSYLSTKNIKQDMKTHETFKSIHTRETNHQSTI